MEKNILEVKIGDKIKPFKEEVIDYYTKQEFIVKGKGKIIEEGDLAGHYITIKLMEIGGEVNVYTFHKETIVKIEK